MGTVKERLQQFLKAEGVSGSEFSRKMGLSPAYLASMRKSMPEEKVERLMEIFPQLNRDWLLYGEGEMYRQELVDKGLEPYKFHQHLVPLVPTQASAGALSLYAEGVSPEDCRRVYSPERGASIAIEVKGDSMEPNIHDGTMLFLQKINDKAFIPWGSPLVLDTENGSVVKMIFPSPKGDDFLEARSYNKDYPPYQIPVESIIGIYRIICMVSKGFTF
ncbi:MAG: helix-turn-helix transcriptional regulator [Muribaculaceae bacterium]|nr:helix-turn-helix transcriptional regulator [Muribaculaceae bacterium]